MAQSNEPSGRPELLVALAAFLVLIGAVVALLRTDLQTALIPVGFAVAATAVLVVLWVRLRRVRGVADAQQLAVDTQRRESERNQQAILRLLDELSSLADGDLTVQATVTEDITGAIADSINYAVDALRGLVTTINSSAISLDGAARQTQALAQHLPRPAARSPSRLPPPPRPPATSPPPPRRCRATPSARPMWRAIRSMSPTRAARRSGAPSMA